MWIARNHQDYALLEADKGERLERWGTYTLVRPDPQIIWSEPRRHKAWQKPDARYVRNDSGGGAWSRNKLPSSWELGWKDLRFIVKPTGFKHMGLFPEQAANWEDMMGLIGKCRRERPFRVLNLFAYTGAATIACAKAGALVTHVDAAKGMVQWARDNAALNGVEARWIVDDCAGFIAREYRRGNRYDGIIMDPPSFGRGANGQTWKLEDDLYELVRQAVNVLADDARFFFLNTYTTGLAPSVLRYILELALVPRFGGMVEAQELGLAVDKQALILPCGATGRWIQS